MILDLVVNLNEKKDLHFTKEESRKYNLREVHTNVIKTSLAFFIAELVYKTINDREENIELYQFLENLPCAGINGFDDFGVAFMPQFCAENAGNINPHPFPGFWVDCLGLVVLMNSGDSENSGERVLHGLHP